MKQKQHSERPAVLRKGKDWMCKCQAINLYKDIECKMILIEKADAAYRLEKQLNSQPSHRKTAKEYQIERERKRNEDFQGLNPYEAILKREL